MSSKNLKKLLCAIVVGAIMIKVSISAFAITTTGQKHATDKWDRGPYNSLWPWNWSKAGQYSNFYCDKQKHTATARIKDEDGKLYEDKATASAGIWAKADTGLISDVDQWNSYYNHIN